MFTDLEPSTFNFLLGEEIHQLAQKLQKLYNTPEESKLAYFYALARSAAFYFIMYGYEVEEIDFSKWDAETQSISEIGCLDIKGYGRVQLIPCEPLEDFVKVPSEAQENILAYMIVELDSEFEPLEEIEEGTILGFVREFQAEVELEQLEDLETFPDFLNSSMAMPEASKLGQEIGISPERLSRNQPEPLENIMDYPPNSVFATNLVTEDEIVPSPPRPSLLSRITSGLRQLEEKLWPQAPISDNDAIPSVAYTHGSVLISAASAEVSPTKSTTHDRNIDLGESGTVLLSVRVNDEYGGLSKVLVELKSLTDQGLPPQLELSIIGESDSSQRSTRENQRKLQLSPYSKQPEDNPLIRIVLGDMVYSFNLDEMLIDESDVMA